MALRKISDYEWASVGAYIAHLEQALVLTQVDAEQVYSFRVTMAGAGRLLRKKNRLIGVLEENNAKLCVYVERHRDELETGELDVIRGMYKTNSQAIGIMRTHVHRLEEMSAFQEELRLDLEETDDDLPF